MPNTISGWRSKLIKPLTPFLLAALALLLGGASVSAQAICRPVYGHIEGRAQEPPICGADFCSIGTFSGAIQGEYVVATTLNTDQPLPDVYFYTGATTATVQIGNRRGTLQIENTGVFRSGGELTELEAIVGGAGDLAGATGLLFVTGASGEETGQFRYEGMVCLP
ncbi:MAG: hypothetical protein DCC55_08060 [Chloroflexi bacterium]|nr:MAG: hypothetical protein DCC55_08060 [Chloroflexota bacterium]